MRGHATAAPVPMRVLTPVAICTLMTSACASMTYDNRLVLYNTPDSDDSAGYVLVSVLKTHLPESNEDCKQEVNLPPVGMFIRDLGVENADWVGSARSDWIVETKAGEYDLRACQLLREPAASSEPGQTAYTYRQCLVGDMADTMDVDVPSVDARYLEKDDTLSRTRNMRSPISVKPGVVTFLEVRMDLEQSCGMLEYYVYKASLNSVRTLSLPLKASPADVEALSKHVHDRNPSVQVLAFEALCRLGKEDRAAVEPLLERLRQSENTEYLATEVLNKLSSASAPGEPACLVSQQSARIWSGGSD